MSFDITENLHVMEYLVKRDIFKCFTRLLHATIKDLLYKNNRKPVHIDSRTKSLASFEEKITRPDFIGDPLKMTDLSGVRIVVHLAEDAEPIINLLKAEFDITNIDYKSLKLDANRFGYRGINIDIQLRQAQVVLPQWSAFKDFKAEIQIHTLCEHTWAALDHIMRYKSESELPIVLKRKLFSISGALEVIDQYFSTIKKESEYLKVKYEDDILKGRLDIELNLYSFELYLKKLDLEDKWANTAEKVGFNIIIYPDEARQYILRKWLRIFSQLNIDNINKFNDLLIIEPNVSRFLIIVNEIHRATYGNSPNIFGLDILCLFVWASQCYNDEAMTRKIIPSVNQRIVKTFIKSMKKYGELTKGRQK